MLPGMAHILAYYAHCDFNLYIDGSTSYIDDSKSTYSQRSQLIVLPIPPVYQFLYFQKCSLLSYITTSNVNDIIIITKSMVKILA